ncbi:F-box protein: endocytic membrane traffic, recycling ReCYcling 1 [Coemansia sp. RSA 1843]|nr:F-box protein: endocytic membrane traffic, recycling ReCYcling 1 [Coemansia sp. RSA 1843]
MAYSLIIIRFHSELVNMVEEYNRMSEESDSTQSTLNQPYSSLTDWEEVIEMAKRPVEDVISCSQPMGRSSSHNGGSSSRSDSFFKTIYQSPLSDATATGSTDQAIGVKGASTGNLPAAPPPTAASSSDGRIESKTFNTPLRRIPQKTFPWQMTPPIEEVAELRQRLKELEQSPLFTSSHIAKRTQKNDMSLPSTKVHSHSNINSINSISDIGKQQSQMSEYEDDHGNAGKLAPSTWLSVPSPRTLLDRTTKFVLNAAHGKSRSLIPTTDDASLDNTSFAETSVQADDIDSNSLRIHGITDLMADRSAAFGDEVDDEGYRQQQQHKQSNSTCNEQTLVVPEVDVLAGKWNAFHILSTPSDKKGFSDDEAEHYNDGRSTTPPGMLRIRRIRGSLDQRLPLRKRTPSTLPQTSLNHDPNRDATRIRSNSSTDPYTGRRAVAFIALPHRVLARIFEFLPIPAMLELLNSCRIVRRVMHKAGPSAYAEGLVGNEAYTVSGMRIWRTMIRRMGWRLWHERIRGREKRQRVSVPRGHTRLLKQLCNVEDEAEIVEIIFTEPDLLFKAIFDNLYTDYVAFRSLECGIPEIFMQALEDKDGKVERRWRSPAELGERLDQLLWFGRGWFTHDADLINKRVVIAADRFEHIYHDRFKQAFVHGDCARMQQYAGILENIREGSGCLRLLIDSHPLFNCGGDLIGSAYYKVLSDSSKVTDSHTFDVFLDGMQRVIEEHARVVAAALPPPVLPKSALYYFVHALFSDREGRGIALATLQNLYAHLRSIPVADASLLLMDVESSLHKTGRPDSGTVHARQAVPDEATKDILYLSTVANVVSLLLVASEKWETMEPVSIPGELGRRCVFSAFTDVIDDYVQLERRIIERAYGQELEQWAAKVKARPEFVGSANSSFPSHPASSGTRGSIEEAGLAPGPADSIRLVNFRHRQQQMDEYKGRVLKVLETKLDISLPPDMLGTLSTKEADQKAPEKDTDNSESAEDTSGTGTGQTSQPKQHPPDQQQRHFQRARRRSSASQHGGGGDIAPLRRTVVGDVLLNAPISIDLCLNMVLTNRDAIDRLAVFSEAPPDMRLRRSAVVAELQALEHTAMVVMVAQGRHTAGAGAASTSSVGDNQATTAPTVAAGGSGSTASVGSAYSAHRVQAEKELREKFTAVELQFFELIHLSDLAVHMLEIYYKKAMCVFIDETDFLNICNQEKKALEHAVDDSVAVGMDCVIEIILRQTQHILDTEQVADDYHPDTNVSLTLTPTLACTRAVQFLGESTTVLQSMTTQKQMREVFLGEIGGRLFNVLLEHIKRFQITEPGGFQLIADLNLYYDWAADNVDPETLRFFTALKDLANCFILAPRDLRGFLRDQYSRHTFDGVMRIEEIYDVVACRADYRAIRSQVEGHCDFM